MKKNYRGGQVMTKTKILTDGGKLKNIGLRNNPLYVPAPYHFGADFQMHSQKPF